MMFLDGPSLFAPIAKWEAWAERLKKLNPHDRTVVAEKKRAERIIARLCEPQVISDEVIPD